jgi:hypothetical protein
MPKINVFNGGMRTAQEPHLIREDESVAFVNMKHVSGILRPAVEKAAAVSGAQKWGHFFTINSTWYWSATPKDYVEFQERLYIGNRSGVSTKIVNGTEYNMGIEAPTTKPTVVMSNETPSQDQITRLDLVAASSGGDIPGNQTLRYRVANVSSDPKYYPSEEEFTIALSGGTTNQVTITCTDTNLDTNIAIFRFFDNYWRKIYEGPGPSYVDSTFDISANAELDSSYEETGLNGVYQYALTFFNTVDGTESPPVLSDEFEANWGTANISNLEVGTDPQVDARRLYRIGGSSTAFTLVEQIDNIVTTYVDDNKDDELEGSLMSAEQNYPPVANLKYMMESYAMLFAADGDKLRFTPIGEPDYWPQTYFLDFPRPIMGLAKTPIGILVFSEFETWLVTGTGPLSLAQQLLTGSQGCINGDTVVNIEGASLWVSTDGVCMSNGGEVAVITRDKLDKLDLSHSVNAIMYDERYYLLMLELGTILMLDLSRACIMYINHDGIRSLNKANDILYGYVDDGVLYDLEGGTDPLLMQYGSPVYIGRGYTVPKTYKNFYVYSEGVVQVLILIDGDVIQDVSLPIQKGNHQVKIPSVNTRGYSLQFFIYGTGTVYEVQWEDGNANQ